jgi:putative transposase
MRITERNESRYDQNSGTGLQFPHCATIESQSMARKARVVAAGVPYHVTQRGNNRQSVFLSDDDRRYYLTVLRDRSRQAGLRLLGYCLMTNHIHLVAVPEHARSLARALGRTHSAYAQRFNRRYQRSGHLWQNRFYSSPLGAAHLYQALAYVDLNPVRAGLAVRAQDYPWSSARAHLGNTGATEWIGAAAWRQLGLAEDWAEILRREVDGDELRAATYAGLPYGEPEFIERLEQQTQRSLCRGTPGPKPKTRAESAAAS